MNRKLIGVVFIVGLFLAVVLVGIIFLINKEESKSDYNYICKAIVTVDELDSHAYSDACYARTTKEKCEEMDIYNQNTNSFGDSDGVSDCGWLEGDWLTHELLKSGGMRIKYPPGWVFGGEEGIMIGVKNKFVDKSGDGIQQASSDLEKIEVVISLLKNTQEFLDYVKDDNNSIKHDRKLNLGEKTWDEVYVTYSDESESKTFTQYMLISSLPDNSTIFLLSPGTPEKMQLLRDMASSVEGFETFDPESYFGSN